MNEAKHVDEEYQDMILKGVEKTEGEASGYVIECEDGHLLIPGPGFEPKTGYVARYYGKGFGYPVRGLDINGQEVYYQTEEEYTACLHERIERLERERKEELIALGGVSHDPGTGKYDWRESMSEISGFGGPYEASCRSMLIATLDHWDNQPESFEPKYHGYENIYGVMLDDNEDAKKLDKAMMDAEILYGNGERERVGDEASGAMHQAVVSHAFFVRGNGWEAYVKEMSMRDDTGLEEAKA